MSAQKRMKPADPKVRNGLLAKVHIAKKELALDDTAYRDTLENLFGVNSAGKLNIAQLSQLLNHFIDRGWTAGQKTKAPRNPNRRTWIDIPSTVIYAPQKRKILALAKALGWDLDGLNKRIKQQFGVARIEWMNSQDSVQTLLKDLVNRCHRAGINPYPER